jgi:hypothetical protein
MIDIPRLPLVNKPATKAEATPGKKLRKPKAPDWFIVQPTKPPIDAVAEPIYGPNMIPKRGARTVARVMNLPRAPIIGNSDTNEKTAYNAEKMQVSASFLVARCSLTPRLVLLRIGLFRLD